MAKLALEVNAPGPIALREHLVVLLEIALITSIGASTERSSQARALERADPYVESTT